MAEFEALAREFQTAGYGLVAIAVDDRTRSEPVRQRLHLTFPILCDQRRETLAAWDLLNEAERGGIAVPGVLVVDRARRIAHRWLETTATRVTAAGVLAAIRGAGGEPPRRIRIGFVDMVRAVGNTLRRGGTTPRE